MCDVCWKHTGASSDKSTRQLSDWLGCVLGVIVLRLCCLDAFVHCTAVCALNGTTLCQYKGKRKSAAAAANTQCTVVTTGGRGINQLLCCVYDAHTC